MTSMLKGVFIKHSLPELWAFTLLTVVSGMFIVVCAGDFRDDLAFALVSKMFACPICDTIQVTVVA